MTTTLPQQSQPNKSEAKKLGQWINEYKLLTHPAKDSLMKYDYRYSTFGVHFVSGIEPGVQSMIDSGFLKEHKNYGYMVTRKGRLVADALKLHEGLLIHRRGEGNYRVTDGVLVPVQWNHEKGIYENVTA